MDEKILERIVLAEKFCSDGDPMSMRTVANEILELDNNSADGLSLAAEAALYVGNLDVATSLAHDALNFEHNHLRGRLVTGGVAMKRLQLRDELKIFDELIRDADSAVKKIQAQLNAVNRKIFFSQSNTDAVHDRQLLEKMFAVTRAILFKALCWSSNGLYLAGQPARAADVLNRASSLTDRNDLAAELYSKHLFLLNYRDIPPAHAKELAQKYNDFFANVTPLSHKPHRDKIHVGYISPDFRQHALANFFPPLFGDFDRDNFSVTCYATGRKDFVTERLKNFPVTWRNLTGKEPLDAAQIINADNVDILVDLSGHSQDSCLPILAHKPAPIQICALGYTASTGLAAVDYFLSDDICSVNNGAFTEKILRLNPCHLCFAPGLIRQPPDVDTQPPFMRNGHITFGCFNNFAKVTDDLLYLWRAILDAVNNSRLILKGKIFSLDDGISIVRDRLRKLSFPIERVEFRPYSPDYLEQYNDVDIALDTFPYVGGTTTCEALYMGVPVVTLRGKSHGSRLGASILNAADINELVAHNPMDYVSKAIQLARRKELLAAYRANLRPHLKSSALMNSNHYIRQLENIFRDLRGNYFA